MDSGTLDQDTDETKRLQLKLHFLFFIFFSVNPSVIRGMRWWGFPREEPSYENGLFRESSRDSRLRYFF